jgi:hypothetical protein
MPDTTCDAEACTVCGPNRSSTCYGSPPTARHIALVRQDRMRAEHHRREERGFDRDAVKHPKEALYFRDGRFRIDLARPYFGVTL